MGTVEVVDYHSIAVGKKIVELGYLPAYYGGQLIKEVSRMSYLGLVKVDPSFDPKKSKLRFLGIQPKAPLLYIGNIEFGEDGQGKDWRFSVLGSDYLAEMKQLADVLAQEFDVNIKVMLESENPQKGYR
jgi:hypothetical protein